MLYHYSAIDRAGLTQKGSREAPDEKTLAKILREEGLLLTASNTPVSFADIFSRLAVLSIGGVSLFDRMIFARNIAVMIGAGLSMTRALEALEEQTKKKRFQTIIKNLREKIMSGVSFSQSLNPYREIFGDFFIHMVEAGEVSGKLEQSLKLLSRQMKRDHDLRSKVRGAMMYPVIVLMALVAVGVLMLIYVVPTLTQTFKDLEIQLPPTTRFIIALSDFLLHYIVFTAVGLVFLIYGLYLFIKSETGKVLFGRFVLHVPVFGSLVKKLNIARLTRTLASLIAAGLSITKSLEITGRILGNVKFRDSIVSAVANVEKGEPLSVILKRSPSLYPPLVIEMISVGEETGTLSRMLLRIALFYEEDVNNTTKNLSSIIEPVMMIIIGCMVGFFAISLIQPLYGSLAGL